MKFQFAQFKKRIILTPIVSVFYYTMTFLLDKSYWLYIIHNENPVKESIEFITAGLIVSFVFIETSVILGKAIFAFLRRIKETYHKMLLCYILLFAANNMIAYFLSELAILSGYDETSYFYKELYILGVLVTLISGIYVTSIYIEAYKKMEREKKEIEIRLLKEKQIKTDIKLNMLKQQIDPHFLFNSFSILSELIAESPETAEKFLDNLSMIYRYILQNIDKNLTSIHEELHLFHSYLYLMKIRYKDSIETLVSPDLQEAKGYLPTASLQLLAENAIRHNSLSPSAPLTITVYKDGDYFVVENNLMPISSKLKTTRLGLKSITDRYSILSGVSPVIQKTPNKFIVKLPIIQQ